MPVLLEKGQPSDRAPMFSQTRVSENIRADHLFAVWPPVIVGDSVPEHVRLPIRLTSKKNARAVLSEI